MDKTTRDLIDAVLTAILVFLSGLGHAQVLSWSEVTTDISGNPIDSSSIYYKLYYNLGSPPFIYASDVSQNYVDLSQAPEGCYNLRVTAVRTDSSPELESDPSPEVYGCVGGGPVESAIPRAPEQINYE